MDQTFDIVLMVGIPGSGKTTFYRERLFPSHLYISLDQLRTRSAKAELFAFALKRHKPCVIDNTNVTAAERRRYISLARGLGGVSRPERAAKGAGACPGSRHQVQTGEVRAAGLRRGHRRDLRREGFRERI